MKVVIQRVRYARLSIEGKLFSQIAEGLLILVGITAEDGAKEIAYLTKKIVALRIFDDEEGVMNLSVYQTNREIMAVSQFTLMASTKKGNRPSYIAAAPPAISEPLYQQFCIQLESELGKPIARGVFGSDMQIELLNDGPVTIIIDTENR